MVAAPGVTPPMTASRSGSLKDFGKTRSSGWDGVLLLQLGRGEDLTSEVLSLAKVW